MFLERSFAERYIGAETNISSRACAGATPPLRGRIFKAPTLQNGPQQLRSHTPRGWRSVAFFMYADLGNQAGDGTSGGVLVGPKIRIFPAVDDGQQEQAAC